MRRFELTREKEVDCGQPNRHEKVVVAEGCLFSNAKVAITWIGEYSSCVWWDNMEDAIIIHTCCGTSEIRWIDES